MEQGRAHQGSRGILQLHQLQETVHFVPHREVLWWKPRLEGGAAQPAHNNSNQFYYSDLRLAVNLFRRKIQAKAERFDNVT
jgi:hypothetical protein